MVTFELGFDPFHQDGSRIYRMANNRFQQGRPVQHGTITYPAVGPATVRDFNEVESVPTLSYVGTSNLQKDNRIFQEKAIYADAQFLSMFTFPLLAGDVRTALKAPRSIAISESNAKKIVKVSADYASLIGKTLKVDTDDECYQISAVMKDFPAASHLELGALMSCETLSKHGVSG